MATNFSFNNGGNISTFEDAFIRRDLFSSGNMWTEGSGSYGTLGNGATALTSTLGKTIDTGNNWKQGSLGGLTAGGIKTDGTLWVWGNNAYGALGDNTSGYLSGKSSPIQTVSAGTNWKQISCGSSHTTAIKTDGSLWTWGENTQGQLGHGTTTNRSSPVMVGQGYNWKQVSASKFQGNTAAIKTDGTLWLWGANSSGQLGDLTRVNKSSPVQPDGGGTNWKQVCSGFANTGAIKTDGTLWTWGYNYYGNLGINSRFYTSYPVQTVSGGTNWKQVSMGSSHSAAIKTDGTLWMWGQGSSGRLGLGYDQQPRSSPVQTIAGGTNWKLVDCGTSTMAIKTDGSLWNWGQAISIPSQTLSSATNWKGVSVSGSGNENIRLAVNDIF